MALPLHNNCRVVEVLIDLIVTGRTVEHLGGAVVAQVLLQVLIVPLDYLFTLKGALIDL